MTVGPTGVRGEESGLVARLTLEQKVRLLTGADSWALHGESLVGLRPMITSDGPAGVRGMRFDPSNPSTSFSLMSNRSWLCGVQAFLRQLSCRIRPCSALVLAQVAPTLPQNWPSAAWDDFCLWIGIGCRSETWCAIPEASLRWADSR